MRRRPSMFLFADPWQVRLVVGVLLLLIIMVGLNIIKLQKLHRAYAGEGTVYGSHQETLQRIWGSIYDCNGELIGGNYFEMNVSASRMALERIGYDQFRKVAELLEIDDSEKHYRKLIQSDSRYVQLKIYPYHLFDYRKLSSALQNMKLGSLLVFDPRSYRYYPEKRFYSGFLSYASPDRAFTTGIERTLDAHISGREGLRRYAHSRAVPVFEEERPVDGDDVYMTIDSTIQFIVEAELRRAVHARGASGGYVLVTRPGTGEILAMSSYDRKRKGVDSLIVAGAYEPGSTIKPLIAAIALDRGVVAPDFETDCENGRWKFGRRTIRDHSPYGVLSLPEIIWHSSNIGAVKLGQTVDNRTLYDGLLRFGFGRRTGIQLPGETSGYFPSPEKWRTQTKASISFGYGLSANVVQMTAALNALVNGGTWVPPTLVKRIVGPEGNLVDENGLPPGRRVISELTSARMRDILRGVVAFGTGTEAGVSGQDIGGKTGTTRKLKDGRYSHNYLASFYGFFPVSRPEVSIFIMVDDPINEYYGGKVAAPLFRDITRKIVPLLMDEIGGSEIQLMVSDEKPAQLPETGPIEKGVVPDLVGLPFRDALMQAHQAGFQVRCNGHGRIRSQLPSAGARLGEGARIALRGDVR